MVKKSTIIAGAVLFFFLISYLSVLLYLPPAPTASPSPSAVASPTPLAVTGSSSAKVVQLLGTLLFQCNYSDSSTITAVLQNVSGFSSALPVQEQIYAVTLNSSIAGNDSLVRDAAYYAAGSLYQYCPTRLLRRAAVQFPDSLALSSGAGGQNVTVFGRALDAFGASVGIANGVPAYVSTNAAVNDSVTLVIAGQVTPDGAVQQWFAQQYLNQVPALLPTLLMPAVVSKLLPYSLVLANYSWDSRAANASLLVQQLNSSSLFNLTYFDYPQNNAVLVHNVSSPGQLNATLALLQKQPYVLYSSAYGDGAIASVQANFTNESLLEQAFASANLSYPLEFPNSTLTASISLANSTSRSQALSAVQSILGPGASMQQEGTVNLGDYIAQGEKYGVFIPPQVTALLNDQVKAGDAILVSVDVRAQGEYAVSALAHEI